jgi:hypothetical protein
VSILADWLIIYSFPLLNSADLISLAIFSPARFKVTLTAKLAFACSVVTPAAARILSRGFTF